MAKKKRRYWLFKSEPDVYSIEDLERDGSTYWEGVRNYQARNLIRDEMQVGDGVLYYHSRTKPLAIVGLARISKEAYPDPTQFDENDKYYDPKATADEPRWFVVDIEFVSRFAEPLTRDELMEKPELDGLLVLKRGQRLSVQPVEPRHWQVICKLAGVKPD